MRKSFGAYRWSRFAAGIAAVVMASGLTLAATAAAPASKASPHASAKGSVPVSARVDINSASKDELAKLPGIGEVYSQKIIDGRPYKSKAELESRNILPKGVYQKIAAHVIAHQK